MAPGSAKEFAALNTQLSVIFVFSDLDIDSKKNK